MPHGSDPLPPAATHRVRWPVNGGITDWVNTCEPPLIDEGVLVLRPAPGSSLWVPLHTVTGPIEIEAA